MAQNDSNTPPSVRLSREAADVYRVEFPEMDGGTADYVFDLAHGQFHVTQTTPGQTGAARINGRVGDDGFVHTSTLSRIDANGTVTDETAQARSWGGFDTAMTNVGMVANQIMDQLKLYIQDPAVKKTLDQGKPVSIPTSVELMPVVLPSSLLTPQPPAAAHTAARVTAPVTPSSPTTNSQPAAAPPPNSGAQTIYGSQKADDDVNKWFKNLPADVQKKAENGDFDAELPAQPQNSPTNPPYQQLRQQQPVPAQPAPAPANKASPPADKAAQQQQPSKRPAYTGPNH